MVDAADGCGAGIFAAHLAAFPPQDVTLPRLTPGGPPVTERLLFSRQQGGPVRRSGVGTCAWKPALATAGAIPGPGTAQEGQKP
ncbi:hypothetical protein [Kitasatospora sp. NPDC059571]|uniref:hypothetical protein n=1 Tax=Kitasatospora sp. NPDC059571 TaxID=3346871 RepID=UPI00367C7292